MAETVKQQIIKAINDSLKKHIAYEFKTESGPNGPWKPKQKPNGKKILIDTGKLRRSFRYTSTDTEAIVNNTAPYFAEATAERPVFPANNQLPAVLLKQIDADIRNILTKEIKLILVKK